jgi:hypothetical protein
MGHPIRHLGHLMRRWWGACTAGAPSNEAEVWAEAWLLSGERRVWRRMNDADRSHALAIARRFATTSAEASRAEMAAALLHDCGKLDSDLGTGARVLATLGGRRIESWRRYHDHEQLGAALLRQAGSDQVTISLVGRLPDAPPDVRAALDAADGV